MSDIFSPSSGAVAHRKLKTKNATKFSPSYGVHKGYIRDPNWPPAVIPENSTATARRERRVPAKFAVIVGRKRAVVSGDLSRGGAMFVLPLVSPLREVQVEFGGFTARVEILSVNRKGGQVAHHARYLDKAEAAPLWAAVKES